MPNDALSLKDSFPSNATKFQKVSVDGALRLALQVANDVIPFEQHCIYFSWPDQSEAVWSFSVGFFREAKLEENLERSRILDKQLHESRKSVFQTNESGRWICLVPLRYDEAEGYLAIVRSKRGKYTKSERYHLKLVARVLRAALSSQVDLDLLTRLHLNFMDKRTLLRELSTGEIFQEYLKKAADVCHCWAPDDFDRATQGERVASMPSWAVRPTAKKISPNRTALLIAECASTNSTEVDWKEEKKQTVYRVDGPEIESIAAYVYRNLRLYVTNDYPHSPLTSVPLFDDTRSHISAPIIAGRAPCAGVLSIESSQPDAYSPALTAAFGLLAAHASWPISRAMRREASTKKVLAFTDALFALRTETTPARLFQRLQEKLQNLGYARGMISRVDVASRRIIGELSWGGARMDKLRAITDLDFEVDTGDRQVLAVISKQAQLINTPRKEPETRAKRLAVEDGDLRPFAIFPLLDNHGRALWTLHIERVDFAPIGTADERLVSTLCTRVMKSLEEERRNDLEREWSRWMLAHTDLSVEALLRGFVDFVVDQEIAVRCRAFIIDRNGCQIPLHESGKPQAPDFQAVRLNEQDTLILSAGTPLLIVRKDKSSSLVSSEEFKVIPNAEEAHSADLNNTERSQWVEAPVRCQGQLIAKVVFDHTGAPEDAFTLGEMRQISRYARTLSIATEAIKVQQRDRDHIRIIRDNSDTFVTEVEQQPKEKILAAVIRLLLKMYLEITKADVVFYRRIHGETLVLEGDPIWQTSAIDGMDVPRVKKRGEGISSRILDMEIPAPIFENHAHAAMQTALNDDQRWSEQERKFLSWIRSEVSIPVDVRGDKKRELRGVIVAVSGREEAFAHDIEPSVQRFWHTANLWFELGELHHGRLWWDQILQDVIDALPQLANASSDAAFFASLATLLSHHKGLGWNRVMIWSCQGSAPQTAELVYALGGVGSKTQVDLHQRVEDDPILSDLARLVSVRLNDPLPHGLNEHDQDVLDPLYQLVVAGPRQQGKPIRIPFGPGLEPTTHPLKWLLERDYAGTPSVQVPLDLEVEGWLQEMNREYPGMFLDRTFAFPLWCAYDRTPEPLGLLLVDMHYSPQKRHKEMIPATRVVLDLVSDILASRYQQRRLIGWLGVLPAVRHGRSLKEVWEAFYFRSRGFLREFEELNSASQGKDETFGARLNALLRRVLPSEDDESEMAAIIPRARGMLDDVNGEIMKFRQALAAAQERMMAHTDSLISDLGSFLTDIARGCEQRFKGLSVDAMVDKVSKRALACDPMILNGTLHCLVENAVTAMTMAQRPLFIRFDASCEPSRCSNFETIVILRVMDIGPGIPEDIAPCIFLEGFTHSQEGPCQSATPPVHQYKGRGLAVSRAQLLSYGGDLQLEFGGPRSDASLPGGIAGAIFIIRFGVKSCNRQD